MKTHFNTFTLLKAVTILLLSFMLQLHAQHTSSTDDILDYVLPSYELTKDTIYHRIGIHNKPAHFLLDHFYEDEHLFTFIKGPEFQGAYIGSRTSEEKIARRRIQFPTLQDRLLEILASKDSDDIIRARLANTTARFIIRDYLDYPEQLGNGRIAQHMATYREAYVDYTITQHITDERDTEKEHQEDVTLTDSQIESAEFTQYSDDYFSSDAAFGDFLANAQLFFYEHYKVFLLMTIILVTVLLYPLIQFIMKKVGLKSKYTGSISVAEKVLNSYADVSHYHASMEQKSFDAKIEQLEADLRNSVHANQEKYEKLKEKIVRVEALLEEKGDEEVAQETRHTSELLTELDNLKADIKSLRHEHSSLALQLQQMKAIKRAFSKEELEAMSQLIPIEDMIRTQLKDLFKSKALKVKLGKEMSAHIAERLSPEQLAQIADIVKKQLKAEEMGRKPMLVA